MTAQPTDDEARPVTSRYSQQTLRRIKHARVTRDVILCVGGVVFAVLWFVIPQPSYTVNDLIGLLTIAVAVVFGIAALVRGLMPPKWDRTWSRGMRYGCSVFFFLFGAYFMVFALDQSGYIGLHGSGVTTNCRFLSSAGLRNGGSYSYDCDINVRWTDGTTTSEYLQSTTPVDSGKTVEYAKSPKSGLLSLFPIGNKPIAAWTQVWFYLLTGLTIFLQSLFALCVLLFAQEAENRMKKRG